MREYPLDEDEYIETVGHQTAEDRAEQHILADERARRREQEQDASEE